MNHRLIPLIVFSLLLAGCVAPKKNKAPFPEPPIPAKTERAMQFHSIGIADNGQIVASISKTSGAQARISWTGGTTGTLFQLRTKSNVLESVWRNIGGVSTNRFAFVPINAPITLYSVQGTEPSPVVPGTTLSAKDLTAYFELKPRAISVDKASNSIVAGTLIAPTKLADLGNGNISTDGGNDGWIAKYSTAGGLIWAKVLTGNDDAIFGVTADSQNNIFVTGAFSGGANTGCGQTNSLGFMDIFVAKYSADGVCLWTKRFGGAGDDLGRIVAVDSSDNVILAATFNAACDFGGTVLTPNGFLADIALVKLSGANGSTIWAKGLGSTANDGPSAIASINGDIVLSGIAGGPINFGGGVTANGGGFVVKYQGNGNFLWSKIWTVNSMNGLAIQPLTGNIMASGGFTTSIDLGGGPLTTGNNGGIFLVSYSPSGAWLWNRAYGGQGDAAASLSASSVNLAMTSTSGYQLDFGNGNIPGSGGYFVANFVIEGNSPPVNIWAKRSFGIGLGIALDGPHVVTIGTFSGTVDFGNGISISARGNTDGFVAQYFK